MLKLSYSEGCNLPQLRNLAEHHQYIRRYTLYVGPLMLKSPPARNLRLKNTRKSEIW